MHRLWGDTLMAPTSLILRFPYVIAEEILTIPECHLVFFCIDSGLQVYSLIVLE